jgi:hypothetical protein
MESNRAAQYRQSVTRRRRGQSGQELMEFGLVFFLLLGPLFLGMISGGLNLVRSNQVNFFCADLASLYISGTDFSTQNAQTTATTLATGLNLKVASGGGKANTGNTTGSGIVTISKIQYVGTTAQPTCTGVSPCNSTSFVFLQRVTFGNGSLASAPTSLTGTPSSSMVTDTSGTVSNPYGDANAKLQGTAQSNMKTLWNAGNSGGVVDGQSVYLVETYFESTGFSFGTGTKGIYAKFFF